MSRVSGKKGNLFKRVCKLIISLVCVIYLYRSLCIELVGLISV